MLRLSLFSLLLTNSLAFATSYQPSAETKRLQTYFSGEWSGDVSIKQDGKTKKEKVGMKCYPAVQIIGVQCLIDWGNPPFELQTIGYDEETKTVHLFVMDGAKVHDHVGNFIDDKTLVLDRPEQGRHRAEKLSYKRVSKKELDWEAVLKEPDGKMTQYNFVFTKLRGAPK